MKYMCRVGNLSTASDSFVQAVGLVPMSVKHILAECPSFGAERFKLYPATENLTSDETLCVMSEPENGSCDINNLLTYIRICEIVDIVQLHSMFETRDFDYGSNK